MTTVFLTAHIYDQVIAQKLYGKPYRDLGVTIETDSALAAAQPSLTDWSLDDVSDMGLSLRHQGVASEFDLLFLPWSATHGITYTDGRNYLAPPPPPTTKRKGKE